MELAIHLKKLEKDLTSTAFINPMFPSWIKSKNNSPRPTYLLAIDTTKR